MALKLVHTADWHLGMTFPAFDADARLRLSRARLDVVDRILGLAERHMAHAVLCAGDLFDDPDPARQWWEGLASKLAARRWSERPLFLLPGNHDPITQNGVYSPGHPFRAALPPWVQVVDRDDFSFELPGGAMLYAAPCRSRSESRDLALSLPSRAPGDERIRIGLVHGQTFDLPGCQTNFPIAEHAAEARGLDYLAIGDTHGFRDVTPDRHAPTVYPGAPEPTHFGEKKPGHAVVVYFPKDRRRRALVHEEPVAHYSWEVITVTRLEQLEQLRTRDLSQHVLRLVLEMRARVDELDAVERILVELEGTEALLGRVGVLQLDRSGLVLETSGLEDALDGAPEVLRSVATRLRAIEGEHGADSAQGELARRALYQLYRLLREAS
ncbi:MAG TPA: metallophosphoesterase [Polyangiaceae bacterium]|jgi:DNA repair exonuclease SbcCD nuclease subunit|nr:metallophosphoesterase [Polyangiaceae bacterium]